MPSSCILALLPVLEKSQLLLHFNRDSNQSILMPQPFLMRNALTTPFYHPPLICSKELDQCISGEGITSLLKATVALAKTLACNTTWHQQVNWADQIQSPKNVFIFLK